MEFDQIDWTRGTLKAVRLQNDRAEIDADDATGHPWQLRFAEVVYFETCDALGAELESVSTDPGIEFLEELGGFEGHDLSGLTLYTFWPTRNEEYSAIQVVAAKCEVMEARTEA